MKGIAVVGVLLFAVGTAVGQTRPRVELELGRVKVWLGMPKEVALKQLTDAHYHLTGDPQRDTQVWQVQWPGLAKNTETYLVEFSGERLSFAERKWLDEGADPFPAILGAFTKLTEQSPSPCIVTHEPMKKRQEDWDRVRIRCGNHSVLLSRVRLLDKGSTITDVSEDIGTMRSWVPPTRKPAKTPVAPR